MQSGSYSKSKVLKYDIIYYPIEEYTFMQQGTGDMSSYKTKGHLFFISNLFSSKASHKVFLF